MTIDDGFSENLQTMRNMADFTYSAIRAFHRCCKNLTEEEKTSFKKTLQKLKEPLSDMRATLCESIKEVENCEISLGLNGKIAHEKKTAVVSGENIKIKDRKIKEPSYGIVDMRSLRKY